MVAGDKHVPIDTASLFFTLSSTKTSCSMFVSDSSEKEISGSYCTRSHGTEHVQLLSSSASSEMNSTSLS